MQTSPQATGSRTRLIVALSVPIIGGMISQNVLNLVDTAMVGTLGNAALAAVGTGSFANFMANSLLQGLSVGVQAMAARRLGAGRDGETALPLNGALLVVLAAGVPLSLALEALAPHLFPLLNGDPAVVAAGVPYLRARLWALAAVGLNFSFRGYWNGINRPGYYMRTLIVMHVTNIALNWVLIFGKLGMPAYGAEGAGIASTVATFVGSATYVLLGFRHARGGGFLRALPNRETLRTLLRLSWPNSVQQFLLAASMTVLFFIIGRVGTAETAAASVLVNVMLVAILPAIAFGIAAASLVGQALGRGDPSDARRWGWDVVKVAVVAMTLLGLPMLIVPDALLGVFIHDPVTIALARPALQLVGAFIGGDAVGMVLLNALLGAGASRPVMVVAAGLQWILFLPAAYLVGPVLGFGLLGIWIAQIVYRMLQAGAFAFMWHRGRWAVIDV